MDIRKAVTKAQYQAERATLIAYCADYRQGRFPARKAAIYHEGTRRSMAAIRRAYYARGNASYRV